MRLPYFLSRYFPVFSTICDPELLEIYVRSCRRFLVNCDCEGTVASKWDLPVLGASRRSHQAQTKRHFKLSSPQKKKKKKNSCQSSDSKHWWPLLNLVSTRGLYEWVKPASGTPSLTGRLLSCATFACLLSFSWVLTHFRGAAEGRWSGGVGPWRRVLITETFMTVFVIFSPQQRGGGEESTQEVFCLLSSSLLRRLRPTRRRWDTSVWHLHPAALQKRSRPFDSMEKGKY